MIKHISGLIAYGLQIAKNQTEKVHFFDARYFEKSSASSLEACYLARWRNIERKKNDSSEEEKIVGSIVVRPEGWQAGKESALAWCIKGKRSGGEKKTAVCARP